jgi:hypothetical protein
MDKNQIKRGAVVAASAATILGLVFATPSFAATSKTSKASSSSSSSSSTAPSFGKGGKGGHGDHDGPGRDANRPAGITKTVTVNVPADGQTYKLVVTDTTVRPAPSNAPAGLPTPPKHTIVLDVTGTGSQTITINDLRPGTYSVALVAVSSTQSLTVEAPASTTTTTTPSVAPLAP